MKQLRDFRSTLIGAYVPALVVILSIIIYALATDKRVWYFTEDPFVLGNLPFYAGVLSSLGNLLWGAAATICFFSFGVLPKEQSRFRPFLLVSGLFTSLLLFDDQFQLHRIFYIKYFHLTTKAVLAGYGLLTLGYLMYFRKVITETEYLVLGLALFFLGAAVLFDTMPLLPRGRTAFSDFLKFFGIVTWVAYFARMGWQALRDACKGDFAIDKAAPPASVPSAGQATAGKYFHPKTATEAKKNNG
jgi:hypothetical protein